MSIRLPMADILRTIQTGQLVPITPQLSVQVEDVTPPSVDRNIGYIIETKAVFAVRSSIRDPREIEHAKKIARNALIRQVYGPVSQEVHRIMILCYQKGVEMDGEIVQALNALTLTLEGRE